MLLPLHRGLSPLRVGAAPAVTPVFVSVSTPTNNSTITVPSGIANGDFLIAFVVNATLGSLSIPAGWTQLGSTKTWSPLGYGSAVATRVASSEPANYSFGSSGNRSGFIIAYRHASSVDASGSLTDLSGTTMTLTGISSSSGAMLLSLIQDRDQGVALTQPSGMTSRLESTSTFFRHGAAELLNAGNSNRAWTAGSSSSGAVGILLAIK